MIASSMRVVESFPRPVRVIEHVLVPLADGTRLAARLWIPDDAEERPVPAVLESLPYGKRDGTRLRDEPLHRYLAGHGFACARVDVRGTGESDGILEDEYSEAELDDAVEVIAWLRAQAWCDGTVGMMGKSWGGFNALQVAARRPEGLSAIVTVCASDDRFADDAHYMGGCLLSENLTWGSIFMATLAQPPDPALVGEGWAQTWRHRLEALRPFPAIWLAHPTRDAYWRRGSVAEDLARIEVPTWAVGGWADGYSNAVPRLLAGLTVPRRGWIGPWAHLYPHEGVPGPAVGFLQELVDWWQRWPGGATAREPDAREPDAEPLLRAWMPEWEPPGGSVRGSRGRWIGEDEWPSPRIAARELHLDVRGLVDRSPRAGTVLVRSPEDCGLDGGAWCGFGVPGDQPGDQRGDDERSLVLDGAPLGERVEILGAPVLEIELASDEPAALLCARLCDVAPDGSSRRVSYGLLNLQHRDSHDRARSLVPGRRERVRLALNDTAHAFERGHRFRLALSTSYWPIAWPSPRPVTLEVATGASRLVLPERPPRSEDACLRALPRPEAAPAPESRSGEMHAPLRTVTRDAGSGEVLVETRIDADADGEPVLLHLPDIDLESGHATVERFRIRPDDPLSACGEIDQVIVARRRGWDVRVGLRTRLTSSASAFRFEAWLEASADGTPFATRSWDERVPRPGRDAR